MIKLQPAVKQETKRIAAGTVILSAVMILVFMVSGYFDATVIWGTLLGTAAAIGNFFLLAFSVQQAAEKMNGVPMETYEQKDAAAENEGSDPSSEKDDPAADTPEIRQAKRGMQASYSMRMLMMGVVAVIGVTVPLFHPVAVLVPFLFPQIVIFIWNFTQSHRKEG